METKAHTFPSVCVTNNNKCLTSNAGSFISNGEKQTCQSRQTPAMVMPNQTMKTITLKQARQLAIQAMQDAEKRRQAEREKESEFWKSLEGVETCWQAPVVGQGEGKVRTIGNTNL